MSERYTELFKVPFEGIVPNLQSHMDGISGVESVSVGTQHHEVNTELDCTITYDTHETDRTRIAQEIEAVSGAGEVTFG